MAKREESFSAVFADSAGEGHDESRKGVVDVLLHLICHMGASPGGFFPILSWQLFRDLLS